MGKGMEVLQAGLLTTVQDAGRFGYQKMGIPVSGAMDLSAYHTANLLAGNPGNEAVLEMTLQGGRFLFLENAVCAVTGADMRPQLDGKAVGLYQTIPVKNGSILSFGTAICGCRAYLAVSGGFDVPLVMGSRSTCRNCAIGGWKGRELKAGDRIPIGKAAPIPNTAEVLPQPAAVGSEITLRVIPGPQDDYFTEKGKDVFYSEPYTVSNQSNRMGCRMEGPAVESFHGTDIISDGTVFGSIQITGAGLPIVLMADRQTTGGYAKIATVCFDDLPLLAQAIPGTKVHFRRIED